MQARLAAIYTANKTLLVNASSLVGTTAVTSGLGFLYWWVAARFFSQDEVGLASALTSTMTLLVTIGVLGLGTLLIGELPRRTARIGTLVTTALSVAGGVSAMLGLGFALLTSVLTPELQFLVASGLNVVLFTIGVGLSAVAQVLDQALIGLLRGTLQFWRNVVFALVKLIALVAVGLWLSNKTSMIIFATWVIGILVSLGALLVLVIRRGLQWRAYIPDLSLLNGLRGATLEHHLLNLTLNVPGLALPLLVTTMLSASLNASFYIAWMITTLVSVGPTSLTTVLYAVGAGDAAALANKTRFTLRMSLLTWGLPYLGLFLLAPFILSLFGSSYAEQADWVFRLIGLSVLPQIMKSHYVPISRIQGRTRKAIGVCMLGALLELALCAVGAQLAGLIGLASGLVVAMSVEAVIMTPTVYQTATQTLTEAESVR